MRSEFDIEKNDYLFDCTWIGYKCLLQISLAGANENLGKVISVFDSTINIKTISGELLVVTLGKIRSPISMNVSPASSNIPSGLRRLVSYGSSFRKQGNETLLIGKPINIDVKKSRIFKNNFEKPCHSHLNRYIDVRSKIFRTLLKASRKGCLLDPDFTTKGLLFETLAQLQSHTRIKDNKKFVKLISKTLQGLCGRGPGYTPSGDDFISGYCALFNSLCYYLNLADIRLHRKKILNTTTWISSKFIEYYEKCVVDEQIQEMINSISTGDPEKYMSVLHQISYRGHTSGADIGIGMTAALCTIIDHEFNTKLLSRFPYKIENEGFL